MTTFNTGYNNTELLDQELTIQELEAVAGGKPWPIEAMTTFRSGILSNEEYWRRSSDYLDFEQWPEGDSNYP